MHSLYLRIFVLFWIAMAFIVGGSIAVTYVVAEREFDAADAQHRPSAAIEASEVLDRHGLPALREWLTRNRNALPDRELYILGPDERDILGQRLSAGAVRRLEFLNRIIPGHGGAPTVGPPPPDNFRPPRFAPQIEGPDGVTYTVLMVPRRPSIFGALTLPEIYWRIGGLALAVTALASWWLAEHVSAPVRMIQQGARTLASESLEIRLSPAVSGRRDELGVLARDFDAMADRLRANRSVMTQLLRDISHELRSPLARMRVALGLARQPSADLPRQLERLEREIERLDGLIGQVLKLARLHGTDRPFEREPVEMDEVIEEVVRDAHFEGALKDCGVFAQGRLAASVNGNRELLRSAIENVLRNAVRYSPSGSEVTLTATRSESGAAITVSDRGPGVPSGDLARIFEPFYRVAESRDRDSGGEGIGLAITSQVMKAHGGSATARNLEGGGLEVTLRLPRAVLMS